MDPVPAVPDLVAFVVFAAVGAFTPGPNTALSLAIGASFGWRRVGPHALGVAVGLAAMIALGMAGAIGLVLAHPAVVQTLRLGGVAWLLWLAWRVARGGGADGPGLERPLAAWQSALLQLVNVKAWMLSIAIAATWSAVAHHQPVRAVIPVLVLPAMTVAANFAWAGAGETLQAWLGRGRRRTWFDAAMGAALAASALAMLR